MELSTSSFSLCCDWNDLPPELLHKILMRIGAVDIIVNVQFVCLTWHNMCKDVTLWKSIDMSDVACYYHVDYNPVKMAMYAVDRSCGQLSDFSSRYFCTDQLLHYIGDRSSNVSCLQLVNCDYVTEYGFREALPKFTTLEELDITYCSWSSETITAIGRCCPQLKSFKFNISWPFPLHNFNDDAFAIAETMPQLQHLQILGNRLNKQGLLAIIRCCRSLKSLDIRQCTNIKGLTDADHAEICSAEIKYLKWPKDSLRFI